MLCSCLLRLFFVSSGSILWIFEQVREKQVSTNPPADPTLVLLFMMRQEDGVSSCDALCAGWLVEFRRTLSDDRLLHLDRGSSLCCQEAAVTASNRNVKQRGSDGSRGGKNIPQMVRESHSFSPNRQIKTKPTDWSGLVKMREQSQSHPLCFTSFFPLVTSD